MSRKISDFFHKQTTKIEESVNGNHSAKNDALVSIKLESEESVQNLGSNNDPEQESQIRIHENVKTEAEKQLLVILPQQKIHEFAVPIKIEDNKSKIGKFSCIICAKTYLHNRLLLDHVRNYHENPGSFKCDICDKRFNLKSNLTAHQKVHNKNRPKPFKCNKCDYAIDLKSLLVRHLKYHENIMKIERCNKCNKILLKNKVHDCRLDCKYCGKIFSQNSSTTEHIKKHHAHEIEKAIFECDICGLKCYRKKMLMNHMMAKHPDGKLHFFICDFDGKKFTSLPQIHNHMTSHLPPLKCDFCNVKIHSKSLKKHIQSFHTGIKQPSIKRIRKTESFPCSICFKILSTKHSFNLHISNHNKKLNCKFCEKLFGSQSSLKTHIRNCHENLNSISCEICDRKFYVRSSLKYHMKTHDPNRPRDLKCSKCDYATDNKKSFEIHLNSHERKISEIASIKNPHKCLQCKAIKDSQKSLKMHIKLVHPKVLVECDICGKKMKLKSHILRHLRQVHKI